MPIDLVAGKRLVLGNRAGETVVSGGIMTADTVVRGSSTIRTLAYDAAGNITTDARSGITYGYTYNARNRLASVSAAGLTQATYV